MSVQTIQPPADPGPRRWTPNLSTLIGWRDDPADFRGALYGFDGERFHAYPVTPTATGLLAAIKKESK